ncbi:MAG: hypothetical protein LH654_07870 [Thermoleophilia bacterium]|nr:hypothetical protein [Thermoleophilia bacterium]
MGDERRSLVDDLTDTVRPASTPVDLVLSWQLEEIEAEHQMLCVRRRRLHESIDMLASLDTIKPDAAALLERYRRNEETVSRRRAELYRRIRELQRQHLMQTD